MGKDHDEASFHVAPLLLGHICIGSVKQGRSYGSNVVIRLNTCFSMSTITCGTQEMLANRVQTNITCSVDYSDVDNIVHSEIFILCFFEPRSHLGSTCQSHMGKTCDFTFLPRGDGIRGFLPQ